MFLTLCLFWGRQEPGVVPVVAITRKSPPTARRGQKRPRSQTPIEQADRDSTPTPARPQRLKQLTEKGAYNRTSRSVLFLWFDPLIFT
jgi:hypothetical protein